jgi:pantoate kinase
MSESRSVFCPGHVTAFFEICDAEENPLLKGSRGAGINLSLGAKSKVTLGDSGTSGISIKINGSETEAETTKSAIRTLMGERRMHVLVETTLDLPMEQGFGMSAAGALSASLALSSLLGLHADKAYEAAHIAEVKNKTGLGDIAGIKAGAVEIRLEPGLPPIGKAERIEVCSDMVLAVVGPPMKTSVILADPDKRAAISRSGRRCTSEFDAGRDIESLFALGVEFCEDTELSSKKVLEAMIVADSRGMATMAMLGNSLFCIGDTDELLESLKKFGPVYKCSIDQYGPKII